MEHSIALFTNMESAIIPASSLEITDTKYTEEQYGDFVDIHGPVLTIAEFQKRRNLPLNEQCSSVFYSKTAHLNDNDFVEIDRSILETIGFKNTVYEVKHKNGVVKLDKDGNPKLKDVRADFSAAIRSLRNTHGFIEGSSFDDTTAHFVVLKTGKMKQQNGGQNKQSIWIKKNALEKWIHFYKISRHTSKNIQNGVVYFIHMQGNLNMFKVGYSTNFIKRLESLQVGNPHLLCLYKKIDNVSRKTETRLHHLFSKRHIRGEWFAITPDMIDSICKLMP